MCVFAPHPYPNRIVPYRAQRYGCRTGRYQYSDDTDTVAVWYCSRGSLTALFCRFTLESLVLGLNVFDSMLHLQSQLNSIQTLARLDGSRYLKSVVGFALGLLDSNRSALLAVTKEECGILATPDGELFDKSLIESVIKQMEAAQSSVSNVRRENKAYSYKE